MRKENIGKFMSVKDLTTYEVLKDEDLKGIKAKGKLLKHKKSGARVLLVENDEITKCSALHFGHHRQTVQEFRILWSIPYSAGQRISRQRIHL